MLKRFAGILVVVLIFSMIVVIPRGYSQLNIEFNYLVDNYNKIIEINLTAPACTTFIPVEVYDANGNLLLEKEIDRYFTNRMNKTRFNRFVLNVSLPEEMPVRVVLFRGSTLERSYTLISPQVEIDLKGKQVKVYLNKSSRYILTVKNEDKAKEYSLTAGEDGWYSVDMGDLSEELISPGAAFYSTIQFPGSMSTTLTRYIPTVKIEAGKDYTRIKGAGISGVIPKISVFDDRGNYKGYIKETVDFKEGNFVLQDNEDQGNKVVRDGDTIIYREKGYAFKFNIPYFFATYKSEDNSIVGTVSRQGKVIFRYGSCLFEAAPDKRGRFKICLGDETDISKLINIKGGYISPAGNQYWKNFDWSYVLKLSPLIDAAEMNIKVMTYNIHHGISHDGKMDIDAIASVIQESGAEVIGLQEVDKRFFRTLFQDQVKMLAQKLNMYYYFGETFNILGAEYGNAILSKFPISSVNNLQLDSKGEQRGILSAKLDINGKEVNFLVTHLSLNKNTRNVQVQQLKRYLDILEGEVVLAGDFNTTPDRGEIIYVDRMLKDAVKEISKENLYTYKERDGTEVLIDYIFLSPEIKVKEVYTINTKASDHLPLVADISIKDI